MKIVLINTICGRGSIGRICADLYEELERGGDEPYMIAGRGKLPHYMKGMVTGNKVDFGFHVLKNFFQGKAGFGSAGYLKQSPISSICTTFTAFICKLSSCLTI